MLIGVDGSLGGDQLPLAVRGRQGDVTGTDHTVAVQVQLTFTIDDHGFRLRDLLVGRSIDADVHECKCCGFILIRRLRRKGQFNQTGCAVIAEVFGRNTTGVGHVQVAVSIVSDSQTVLGVLCTDVRHCICIIGKVKFCLADCQSTVSVQVDADVELSTCGGLVSRDEAKGHRQIIHVNRLANNGLGLFPILCSINKGIDTFLARRELTVR